jgi:hypothetical protein
LKNKIQILIKNFIESTTNIATLNSRTLFVREHLKDIISLTDFLPENSKTNERLHIIYNNLSEEDLKCPMCVNKRKFYTFTSGYNLCCSQSCATKYQQAYLIEDKGEMYRKRSLKNSLKPEEVKRSEVQKRINTTIERYGKDAFSEITRKGNIFKLIKDYCGMNFYERRSLKQLQRKLLNPCHTFDISYYRFKVYHCMKKFKNDIFLLKNYNKRGCLFLNKNAYHLDHKYSIYQGFKDNIPPYIIGHINNLEMIPAKINLIKNRKCSIEIDDLVDSIFK